MLARCGRAAHICEANKIGLKIANKNLRENRKNRNCLENEKVANMGQGFRGNCDSQGKLGMCPSLAEPDASGFPKKNLLLGKRSFASVRFAGGCVVRIVYESLSDSCFLELFLFLRMANRSFFLLFDFSFLSSIRLLKGTACPH